MDWENHLIKHLQWSDSIINREAKEHVAREIAATAKDGDVIGAGSGSTVYLTLFELARRIREEHLHIEVIPASQEISMTCIQLGIPQTILWNKRPDWTFDGADEVDPQRNLIKGRGGAMFKEKLLIRSSRKTFIIIDPSKRVNLLGNKFPIPVEVFPDSLTYVDHELQRLGHQKSSCVQPTAKTGLSLQKMGISSSTPVLTISILRSKNNSKPLPVS